MNMYQNTNQLGEITRKDFPLFLKYDASKERLIYLDHAATSQKPKKVIDRLNKFYTEENANVHRGAHQLSSKATTAFENAREITANFINASTSKEIVFTRNATEAINLVANTWALDSLQEGDEILLTLMEHHSNIVPWQIISKRIGCKLRYVGLTESGELDMEDLSLKLNEKTKLISLLHVSNTLGCCNPISEITKLAKKVDALVLLDACQSLAHKAINVSTLGIDFLVGSSHKVCGPTGSGFLWGREELLYKMPPFLGGGEMIQTVNLYESDWADLPHKFEAGTPAIGEAIGMGSALNYLQSIGLMNIEKYEIELTKYLFDQLKSISNIKIIGPDPSDQFNRAPLATFNIENLHANDIAELLNTKNICIRSGHHCCQPLHSYYGLNSSARASLSFTTTFEEIDMFIEALKSTISVLTKFS